MWEGVGDLTLQEGIDLGRLHDRNALLRRFDKFSRDVDTTGAADAMRVTLFLSV